MAIRLSIAKALQGREGNEFHIEEAFEEMHWGECFGLVLGGFAEGDFEEASG